jgi:hypothetical protein
LARTSLKRRYYQIRRRLLFAFVAVVLVLAAAEVAIRATGLAETRGESLFSDIYDVNYAMAPHAMNPWTDVEEFLNGSGFRGHDVDPKRPPGVYRILSVGDSTTFGTNVRNEQTYTYRLGEILRDRGVPVETINAGMPGSTLWKQAIMLEKRFREYEFDLVVLYTNYGYRRDYLELRRFMEENRLRLQVRDGLARLHLYRLLRLWLRPPDFSKRAGQYDLEGFANGLADPALREEVSRYTERDLRTIKARCDALGVPLVVVPLLARGPFQDAMKQGLAPGSKGFRWLYGTDNSAAGVGRVAKRLGLITVAPEDAFLAAYVRDEMFLDPVHFSAAGHTVMAGVLADAVCRMNLLPRPCRSGDAP